MPTISKIAPCLWFDHEAEQAAQFYASIFKESRILMTSRYGEAGREVHGRPAGSVMTVEFELAGQRFTALNGGPHFKFNEAISLQIDCETQQELDYYWDALTAGGDPKSQQCGWLKDKFGVSWQVVSFARFNEWFGGADRARADRVMSALLPMKKIDLPALERAAVG